MRINDPSIKLLKTCLEEKVPILFSGDGLDIVFQTLLIDLGDNHVSIINKVPPQYISQLLSSKSYNLQCKMTRFTTTKILSDGENIVFGLTELNEIEETRMAERFPFQSEERVVCKLINPLDKETVLIKNVLDMSATGISIRCPKHSKLFEPGRFFPDIRIIIDGEQYNRTAATVVYSRKLMDLDAKLRVQVGLKFDGPAPGG